MDLNPIRKFGPSIVSPDIGRDAGGIYRHITREFHMSDVLKDGEFENINWFDICKMLFSVHELELIQVNILDTVIWDGDITHYLFTNQYGHISKKSNDYLNITKIKEEFQRIQSSFSPFDLTYFAYIYEDHHNEPTRLVNTEEFNLWCDNRTSSSSIFQCYMPCKNPQSFRSFRTSYSLDRSSQINMKTDILDVSNTVSGSKRNKPRTSMSRLSNKLMEDMTLNIVNRIKSVLKGQVIQISCEFVQDVNGSIWLIRTCDCILAQNKPLQRLSSPENFKQARVVEIAHLGSTNNHMNKFGGLEDISENKIGRFSDERVLQRLKTNLRPVDKDAFNRIVEDIDYNRAISRGATGSPTKSHAHTDVNYTEDLSNTIRNIPNARLGSETQAAIGGSNNTQILGSSQLNGCKGEYCNFDTSALESSESDLLDHNKSGKGGGGNLSDFRKRLIARNNSDESFDEYDEINSQISDLMIKAKSTNSFNNVNMYRLPLKTIIQARQEMGLVKLQLRRHMNHEKGDYVSEENFNDIAMSSKLPAHYYQEVLCCKTCFQIYNIIDDARNRALRKIENARVVRKDESSTKISFDEYSSSVASLGDSAPSLSAAYKAIEGLTKVDIAEIRTMTKPPAAVEVVIEAVIGVLTGKIMTFQDSKRLLSGGEAFLTMIKDFKLEDITDQRLKLVEPYVDNPLFRPHNVAAVSQCAAKFCAWILGVVQAARWQRGYGHKRTDLIKGSTLDRDGSKSLSSSESKKQQPVLSKSLTEGELTFVQKLERKKANKVMKESSDTDQYHRDGTRLPQSPSKNSLLSKPSNPSFLKRSTDRPVPPQMAGSASVGTINNNLSGESQSSVQSATSKRESRALAASQKKASDRLASLNKSEANTILTGHFKEFRCNDGITKIPYVVLGSMSLEVKRCNFVVIHDFFDTCDATAILFKQIVQRHEGCQVLCFNYPGQANTVWPRPPAVEKERGAPDPVLTNDWIANKVHELLQYAEGQGDMLFTTPFHLLGIGNGVCIASSFCRLWGNKNFYSSSLKSLVSINGFLYPDPQLSAILHSAAQVFESTPHNRPDIPISYWSRFIFSEDYLRRVNPNLALNILTAVSNPITNDGRLKIVKGCLQNRDLRSSLSPDFVKTSNSDSELTQIPLILVQSTENFLVNASNVDSFLTGRTTRHLWSHQLNILSESTLAKVNDVTAQWVGKMSKDPSDYQTFSILGSQGLRMILDTLNNSRGAFVMWVRAGHALQQENKTAIFDLIDILACPTEEYSGLALPRPGSGSASTSTSIYSGATMAEESKPKKFDLVFTREKPTQKEIKFDEPETLPLTKVRGIEEHKYTDSGAMRVDKTEENPSINLVVKAKDDGNARKLTTDTKVASTSPPTVIAEPLVIVPPKPQKLTPAPIVPIPAPVAVPFPEPITRSIEADVYMSSHPSSSSMSVASHDQKKAKVWAFDVPSLPDSVALEAELAEKQRQYREKLQEVEKMKLREKEESLKKVEQDQSERMKAYQSEDNALLVKLEQDLEQRKLQREAAEKQRRIDVQNLEMRLVKEGLIPPVDASSSSISRSPVKEMQPMNYEEPVDLPTFVSNDRGMVSQLDDMVNDEELARKRGIMSMEDYDKVKRQMAQRQLERGQKMRHLAVDEQQDLVNESVVTMQRFCRGFVGRRKAARLHAIRQMKREMEGSVIVAQSLVRGKIGRKRFNKIKRLHHLSAARGSSILFIQSFFRGYLARRQFKIVRRNATVRNIQRVFRGHLGRLAANRERYRLESLRLKQESANKIQSAWRMKVAREEFRSLRIHMLAAMEIQRLFRGFISRKSSKRRKQWEIATPGPERIKLGLQLIEESKVAFERQQEEIDALHRAQERAEARVSHIYADLKESEKELVVLERELQEIDHIERDLQVLTHERDLLVNGIHDAAGLPRLATRGHDSLVKGVESNHRNDPDFERRRKAEAYALEMTIQIKRAEREKKRQELETEFAAVFQEVEKKKKALQRLETSLSDMEATRERKDREFKRLQKNLMQLLLEQKKELDDLREKGIELETATAVSAAAATATAMKAKEHEKRSASMFSQTEELMKFQFMSMSLSYFSSLNMLKQLRDMNADTTSASIVSSAEAAATAAAAASAANLPNMKNLKLGANDFVESSIQKKRQELELSAKAEKDAKVAMDHPLPPNVRMWTINDVCKWLETLFLGQYVPAFREAAIDGPFLLELREEDLSQVLGINHKLHVRKIIVSRENLKPLNQREMEMKVVVEREEKAEKRRDNVGVPDLDTVYSQVRNGRIKRVEESLNLGFSINAEDEKGNTMLLVAAQNNNKRIVEMLVLRGANVNHQNAQGNTALHFALAFDSEGTLGEYLIEHGADDSIENVEGLTPYDGLAV